MANEQDELMTGTLSAEERGTVAEIISIAMGAASATLGLMLGSELEVTAPNVQEYGTLADMPAPFGDEPTTMVQVQYQQGLQSTSVLLLRTQDAQRLADTMLGGGSAEAPAADGSLSELQAGALGELMNQMMSSAATGLASVIHQSVEVASPTVMPYTQDALLQLLPGLGTEALLCSAFQIQPGDQPPIEWVELRSVSDARQQIGQFMAVEPDFSSGLSDTAQSLSLEDLGQGESSPFGGGGEPVLAGVGAASGGTAHQVDPVMVRPVEFSSFDQQPNVFGEENKNLELVMDVTLNLTVELGKTELSIKDVLELTRGSVIELDRVAGEPVDLMANGKLIAKGEVVVIEDNFGLRITSIVSPADRLRGL